MPSPTSQEELVERLRTISTNMAGHVDAGDVWDAAALIASIPDREQIAQIVARAYGGSLYPGIGTPGDYPTDDVDYRAAEAILCLIGSPQAVANADPATLARSSGQ